MVTPLQNARIPGKKEINGKIKDVENIQGDGDNLLCCFNRIAKRNNQFNSE